MGSPFAISGATDIFRTGGGSNYGAYANPEVDELLEEANAEPTGPSRPSWATRSTSMLTDDMATIPLYTKPTFIA